MRVLLAALASCSIYWGCGRYESWPAVSAISNEQTGAGVLPAVGAALAPAPQVVELWSESWAGLYWGEVAVEHGAEVVMFLLAPDGSGVLYSPPGLVPLCITRSSGDGIAWESGASFGWRYTFTGQLTPYGMSGILRLVRTRRGPELSPIHVEFERIERQALEHPWSSFFSNVVFVEEAGDLVGTEVLLLRRSDQIQGAVTFYEGGPGSPLPFERPSVRGDTISFSLTSAAGSEQASYALVHHGSRVELIATGHAAEIDTVPQKQSIMEFMSREAKPGCDLDFIHSRVEGKRLGLGQAVE